MIDTALAYLYSIPPGAATALSTLMIALVGTMFFGSLKMLGDALDNDRVLHWAAVRARFLVAWWRCRVLNQVVIYSRTAQGKPLI